MKTIKATLRVAFCVLGLLSLSCREDSSPTAVIPLALRPVFTAGDVYLYDALLTDEYGYTIYSSRTKVQWKVLSTGFTVPGIGVGTVIVDSASVLRDSASVYDTVTVAVAPNGDLYRYGFLATIARIRKRPPVPESWDRIAAPSVGSNRWFLVGTIDTAGTEKVYGMMSGTADMYAANVKGQQLAFPAFRVDIGGPHIAYTFWLSDAPTAIPVLWLEPGDGAGGTELTLTEIRAGG